MLESPGFLYVFENSFHSEAIQWVVRSRKYVDYGRVSCKFLLEKVALSVILNEIVGRFQIHHDLLDGVVL